MRLQLASQVVSPSGPGVPSRATSRAAELSRLLGDLAATAQRLPQLLDQLCPWLDHERDDGRLRVDTDVDPVDLVALADAQLTCAGRAP